MHSFLFYLAASTLVVVIAVTFDLIRGDRSIRYLRDQPPVTTTSPLKVSVIVAARNEARKIEPALQSLLEQDYPNIETIVVNDRSEDETGQILDRIPGITVVHVTELPPGWLGKNHALHLGAERATGQWLLFTDADVHMEPSAISRAVGCARDHIAVSPQLTMPGTLLQIFAGTFMIFFGMYARPWKAPDPRSPRHIGVGAFNLVRAEVYRAIGGHTKIAMRPDDDMKFGKLIKKSGYRQELLFGDGMLWVEWYSSVGELARGLEKNAFAAVEYQLWAVAVSTVANLLIFVWPVVALLVTGGITWWLNFAIVVLLAALYIDTGRHHEGKWWHCAGLPVMALLVLWIIWCATLKTIYRDGIDWRGTHYSLAELKANRV